MTHFEFLGEFPDVAAEARMAESTALSNPRIACFYARRVVELALHWAFANDPTLKMPYDDDRVSTLLHDPGFKRLATEDVFRFGKQVIFRGNRAVHDKANPSASDAVAAVSGMFEFTYWFARTYNRQTKPAEGLRFDPKALPNPRAAAQARAAAAAEGAAEAKAKAEASLAHVQELEAKVAAADAEREAERERAMADAAQRASLEAELKRLQAEVAEAKAAAAAAPDNHDYSEAETRDWFIDLLLKEAGWALDRPQDREFPVEGMPNGKTGRVDYVLWGDDGRPLALIEAKRTMRDARAGQHQAELYADCLEAQFDQRPVIFYTNGFEHWLWDDLNHPPRRVAGFYSQDELELMIQRRASRHPLTSIEVNTEIVERAYQHRAIRKIGEAFEADKERKALLVMATGSGKTRTVIALTDVLMRANWAKRVLFLADRTSLVNQAINAFKTHLPDSSPVNLLTDRDEEGRVYACTYPTMMNLIEGRGPGEHRFGSGYFDLVVIDEAHRSVFKRYRAIFDHFDSLLVGLTATPREEIDRSTYSLFELEEGVPTDFYPLEEAVADGYLVPPRAVSVPTKFQREGIRYDELSDEDKETWDELEWDEDGGDPPDEVAVDAINSWLFNEDTVDKVLETLMTKGITVAGGDRIGKTIIFAKGQRHADYIAERFNANYPQHLGKFARVITHKTEHNQDLIDRFSIADSEPYIAISVDMLDTGIDVPEVVNLVFFKQVRSKIKFWQMLGRGTRLCPDLFGPGLDKENFAVFDFCENFEFFNEHPDGSEGAVARSVRERRFASRVDLLATLRANGDEGHSSHEVADLLWREVDSMNVTNFVVRPHRRLVERFKDRDAWVTIGEEDLERLASVVAGLPAEKSPEALDTEEARRFDVLLISLQLALLRSSDTFPALRERVMAIAALLEEYPTIPAVATELGLIVDLQTEGWWEGATVAALEQVRKRLRVLVGFIEKRRRKIVYTDFEDLLGDGREVVFPGITETVGYERFRKKAMAFLRANRGETAVEKIHRNWPITDEDLAELQRILVDSGVGTQEDLDRAQAEAGSFGVFVRSLVGLDRNAAKEAFGAFLSGGAWTAAQIEFVNLVIDALSQHGTIDASQFYGSPFTDVSPLGPEGLFAEDQIDRIVAVLDQVRHGAEVA